MKKSLLALAVGAAFAAPAAYADVTLSGAINAGPAYVKQGDGSTNASNSIRSTGAVAAQGQTSFGINSNYSNITISSVDDLGGGLKLDFAYQIIAAINSNNGLDTANRNSHIGLVGESWGGIWWGTNEQLYERYLYSIDPLDGAAGMGGNLQILGSPGYGSVFDAPTGGGVRGTADFYRRTENSIWYDSPNYNGFTWGAYTQLPTNKSTGGAPAGTADNPSLWGFGAKYVGTTMPLQVWGAYEQHKDFYGLAVITGNTGAGATGSKDKGLQFGVGYTFGDIFAFANWEQLKYESDNVIAGNLNEYKRNAYSIGMKWNLATGYVGAQWVAARNGDCTINGATCSADKTSAQMIGLGYYHNLSKQSQAYVMGTWLNNADLNSYVVAGGGTSAGPGASGSVLGSTILGLTVGLKHTF
jgi:predicted porin